MREIATHPALPLRPRPDGRRKLDERLALAAPWLVRTVGAVVQRLPVRSLLRGRLVTRMIRTQYEAFRRRGFEVVLSSHDPEVEVLMPRESGSVAGADLDEVIAVTTACESSGASGSSPGSSSISSRSA